jgi:excisionase family DNA binding protein
MSRDVVRKTIERNLNMTLPTDRLPTIEDVATHLGVTPRSVRQIVRKHHVPVLSTGRHIRFDDHAITAFYEALRCRSQSTNAPTVLAAPSKSRAPSNYRTGGKSTFDEVRERLIADLQPKRPPRSKRKSSETPTTGSVVALDPTRTRSRNG